MHPVCSNFLLLALVGVWLLGSPCFSFQTSPVMIVGRRSFSFPRNTNRHEQATHNLLSAAPPAGDTSATKSALYHLLAVPGQDNDKPGSNFFYNDEVISHLHGYMLLVGLFAARDETFLLVFCGLASLAAGATLGRQLPANPRVPALVAVITLTFTTAVRYGLQYYDVLPVPAIVWGDDFLSAQQQSYFEAGICALNVAWGWWGSWQTKESVGS